MLINSQEINEQKRNSVFQAAHSPLFRLQVHIYCITAHYCLEVCCQHRHPHFKRAPH